RDDDRPLDAETLDQALQIAGLVVKREAVIGPAGLGVAAAVIGQAAMVGREVRKLVLPVFHAMDFAMDENHVGALALLLVIEIAAVGIDDRHGRCAFSSRCRSPAPARRPCLAA